MRLSRAAAVAQLDILRVRQARAASLKQLNAALENRQSMAGPNKERRDEIRLTLLRLSRLDRYAQRAAWARNKALRQMWAEGGPGRTHGA